MEIHEGLEKGDAAMNEQWKQKALEVLIELLQAAAEKGLRWLLSGLSTGLLLGLSAGIAVLLGVNG